MKEIVLAGGCFWGAEKYLAAIQGVVETQVGYANGRTANPTYEEVSHRGTGHAEAVLVRYDETALPLDFLLDVFYDAIDPTTHNRQGGDVGPQYRTGVYYTDPADRPIIENSLKNLEKRINKPVAIELMPLDNYYPAEEYHQKYLDKNPGGYCHIGRDKFAQAAAARPPKKPGAAPSPSAPKSAAYHKPDDATLQKTLTSLQYEVTQHAATEPPFRNAYWDEHRRGIYLDVTTGEPLFASSEKFDSGSGWPSFTRPIDPSALYQDEDLSHGMRRVEVRSKEGGAHLGHLFPDGPPEAGGMRYCINSAALRFVPYEEMDAAGYGELKPLAK